jgi:hypothetical protein
MNGEEFDKVIRRSRELEDSKRCSVLGACESRMDDTASPIRIQSSVRHRSDIAMRRLLTWFTKHALFPSRRNGACCPKGPRIEQ